MCAFDNSASQPRPYRRIAVLGAGAWGTALASVACRAGRETVIWARRGEIADEINTKQRNSAYLDDTPLPKGLRATSDLAAALRDADAVLLVTPSASIRDMAREIHASAPPHIPVIVCAKGIEPGTGLLMSQIVEQEAPGREIGALSGPTFADEVARDLPAGVTIAAKLDTDHATNGHEWMAARMAISLSAGGFRAYVSHDVIGVEVGGAMKNVIAIACGIAEGAGFQANMRAALITRGLDEMKQLAAAIGGERETVTGLSGLGDLSLTCSSHQSRNLRFGVQLGQGIARAQTFDGKPVVVEGARNCVSVTDLARQCALHLPICEAVRAIVAEDAAIAPTLAKLWTAPLEAEPRALDVELRHPAARAARLKMEAMIG
ncbi:MAG: NAD(P)-dependent glycerol-3-phosphate dehydrogenase [Neomegalonema sp.]|nr:NAD(P)-dependent glycerol-3-phosphate dehydrogenase [Neomegalonema sp.]